MEEHIEWLGSKRALTVFEQERVRAGMCMADSDGDCYWSGCPQEVDHKQTCPRWTIDNSEGRSGG